MIRNILSVIVAFFIGGLCVFAVEKIGHMSYPVPNSTDFEVLKSYYLTAPAGAFLFVLLAQSAGSIVGGLVTGIISTATKTTALVYGVLALIMAAINVFMIPSPIWFSIIALVLPIPLSLFGSKIGQAVGFGKN